MDTTKCELNEQAKQTAAKLLETLEAFDPQKFNQTPPLGGWTAGQVAEHLLKSAGVVEVIAGNTKATERPANAKVDAIASIFLDFTTKLQSPEFIIPEAKEYDQQEMIARLKAVWTKLTEAIRLLDLSALCMDFELPGLGHLTRLEWISFYIFHTQRHLRQLDRLLTPEPSHPRRPHPRP
ncbi:MAG TPA: DinB family protein, partial [Puia sp.]|nr:DinB family protein [Puia sp.]